MTCHGILVVEDDDDMREAVAMAFEAHALEATCVENGVRALAHLRSNPPPCVILLDLWMPEMDGDELGRHLAADTALAKIPIVVLSALENPGMPAARFLRKPVDVDTLISAVAPYCKTH